MRRPIILLVVFLFLGQILVQAREIDELGFAQKLYQDQMYELAAEQLRGFLRDRPADPKASAAQLLLAHCYLEAEKPKEALHNYQDFIVNYPDDIHLPEAWKGCARSLISLGRSPKAAETYLKLQNLFPGSHLAPEALLEAGKIFSDAEQAPRAIQALRRLITEYRNSPLADESHYWLGICSWKTGTYADALSEFAKVSSAQWRPRALLEITRIRLGQNDLNEARNIFSRLKKDFPKDPTTGQAAVLLAGKLREKGQFSQAAQFLHQASGILPGGELKENALLDLADSYSLAEKDSLAILWYQRFLEDYPQSPRRPEALLGLERTYLNKNDLKSALRTFRKLQALAPDSKYAKSSYQLLAQAYLANAQAADAAGFYTEYLSLSGQKEEADRAKFELARIYQRDLHWLNRAILLYQDLAQGACALAESSQFALARCLEQQGESKRAREEYQVVLQRFPTGQFASKAQQRLEYIEQFSPDWRSATKRLVQVLKDGLTGGSEEPALYSLALTCYKELKDFEGTASVLRAYVERYPQSSRADSAQYLLAQCYLKLHQKCVLDGQPQAAKEFSPKAAQAHQTLVKNYPKSSWANDAAIFLPKAVGQMTPRFFSSKTPFPLPHLILPGGILCSIHTSNSWRPIWRAIVWILSC
jgi:TolA-binding protein